MSVACVDLWHPDDCLENEASIELWSRVRLIGFYSPFINLIAAVCKGTRAHAGSLNRKLYITEKDTKGAKDLLFTALARFRPSLIQSKILSMPLVQVKFSVKFSTGAMCDEVRHCLPLTYGLVTQNQTAYS